MQNPDPAWPKVNFVRLQAHLNASKTSLIHRLKVSKVSLASSNSGECTYERRRMRGTRWNHQMKATAYKYLNSFKEVACKNFTIFSFISYISYISYKLYKLYKFYFYKVWSESHRTRKLLPIIYFHTCCCNQTYSTYKQLGCLPGSSCTVCV